MRTTQKATAFAVLLAVLLSTAGRSGSAAEGQRISAETETKLLAILRSDAAAADKALACKRLAIDGSSAAVPDLARLLHDKQLASWARIALEAIPGAEADQALRSAADALKGELLVGAINSIGVRRDASAVAPLTERLKDDDAEVAAAAAVALGRIGDAAATLALRGALAIESVEVRAAVAEGCILCAERLQAAGKLAEAAELYDQVRAANVPQQRRLEATRGAILARDQAGIPLLLEQFRSPDHDLFQLALGTAREFPGGEVDRALAGELARAAPERAALIVQAMADRPETVVLPAVAKIATEGPKEVRIAALAALGRVGDASCLAALLNAALDADDDLEHAAKTALADLPGAGVDAQIVALVSKAEGPRYTLLLELVGQRRIDAVSELVTALDHADATVRAAALTALGETVGPKELSVLIARVVSPKRPEDAAVAERALKVASIRMPDREQCAAELLTAIESTSSSSTKSSLLQVLAAVGGSTALTGVGAAAKSGDAQLQDVGSRLLGEWMTEDAAPVLLELAKSAPEEKIQARALRGYLRIARQFVLPDEQRAEMCAQAFQAAHNTAEQKLVLDVLRRHPSALTLKLAIRAMSVAELKEDATAATLVIAQSLGGDGVDVGELLSGAVFENVKLQIVKGEYGAGATKKDVTAVLRKQAGALPLIALPAGYNASFGGDPIPGTVKQLRIEYEMNGRPGEAVFAENSIIVLPMPK